MLLTIALHRLKIKQFGCLNLLQQIVTFCRIRTLPMFHLFLGCVMTQATSWGDPCFRINLKSSMNSGRMYTLPGDFPLRTCTVGVLSCTDPSKKQISFPTSAETCGLASPACHRRSQPHDEKHSRTGDLANVFEPKPPPPSIQSERFYHDDGLMAGWVGVGAAECRTLAS